MYKTKILNKQKKETSFGGLFLCIKGYVLTVAVMSGP